MGKRKLIALLNLSFWCLVMVERLFLAVPWDCLQFVIVVFPDHTHLLNLMFLAIPIFDKLIRFQCPNLQRAITGKNNFFFKFSPGNLLLFLLTKFEAPEFF